MGNKRFLYQQVKSPLERIKLNKKKGVVLLKAEVKYIKNFKEGWSQMEFGIGMVTLVSSTSSFFFGGKYATNMLYLPNFIKIQ